MDSSNTPPSKADRLKLFFERLRVLEPAANHDEALALLTVTLNAVEDEFSGLPYDPKEGGDVGRMYAPKNQYRYPPWERPGVICYRQVGHAVFIADNGAFEVRPRARGVLGETGFEKPGHDGRKVSDYDSTQ